MKKIELVFRNRCNPEAIRCMRGVFEDIFSSEAQIECCFLNELDDESPRLNADVYAVIHRGLLGKLRNHVESFKNIVVMTRSIDKSYLPTILEIPKDADVLLVNDTLQSAEEMVAMFYELGVGHINLIPYDEAREKDGIYRDIEYAITPDEPHLVPPYIKHVINTGYRKFGFDTLVQVMNALELNKDDVNFKLIEYIETILEPMQDFQISYLNNFLQSRMLNEYVYDSASAIFVVDIAGRLVYFNKRAKDIFGFSCGTPSRLEEYLPQEIFQRLQSQEEIARDLFIFEDTHYILDKVQISVGSRNLGYFVTMQDEIVLKDLESSFYKQLKEKGLYARYHFDDIIHITPVMGNSIQMAKKAAATEYTILITGESGTGKELFAQSIHNHSDRSKMPFVGVNCAAIPESLLESELFGYDEGAFTGACKKGKLGYFEQADKGTIFLDEIGDISPSLQSRLLRVLQEKQIMRVGSDKVVDVDVRIIAATNKDLKKEVDEGLFRNDLYYRLNVLQVCVPPLRERKADIPLLFSEFMGKDYHQVSAADKEILTTYDWPGNVRELENCALYYKTLSCLPPYFYKDEKLEKVRLASLSEETVAMCVLEILRKYSQVGHGMGRTLLLQYLKEENMKVSDGFLRTVLAGLQERGLIVIGKGRKGTKLTEEGQIVCDTKTF